MMKLEVLAATADSSRSEIFYSATISLDGMSFVSLGVSYDLSQVHQGLRDVAESVTSVVDTAITRAITDACYEAMK